MEAGWRAVAAPSEGVNMWQGTKEGRLLEYLTWAKLHLDRETLVRALAACEEAANEARTKGDGDAEAFWDGVDHTLAWLLGENHESPFEYAGREDLLGWVMVRAKP